MLLDERKMVTVSWKKICRPFPQGGLNIISLISLNKATNLKLYWELPNSQKSWTKLLKDRVIKNNKIIQHHIYSSLWSSIKDEYSVIKDNSVWLLGDGKDINFWNDCWCGPPFSELLSVPIHIKHWLYCQWLYCECSLEVSPSDAARLQLSSSL
jgi:hypothetical protein